MAAQKNIEEAVEVIKTAVEKKIAENTEKFIRSEIEQKLLQQFLEALTHKVEQVQNAKVVDCDYSKSFINFCCEIPKIDPADTQIPRQLINAIDDVNINYFFKRETNLHLFRFCSKYFMFPQFCTKRQVNAIHFNWSKSKFDETKTCFCFMCKFNFELAEEQEKKKEQSEKNDN